MLRWGKLGGQGQSRTKEFDSPAVAKAELEKLVTNKLKRGYAKGISKPVAKKASAKKASAKKASAKKASAKKASAKKAPNRKWIQSLSTELARLLDAHARKLADVEMTMLALDCHPWHGVLGLCLLTTEEAETDPELRSPEEMASWQQFHFPKELRPRSPLALLGQEMQLAYETTTDRPQTAIAYLKGAAQALSSRRVQKALARYSRSTPFTLSVTHPDSNEEFVVHAS